MKRLVTPNKHSEEIKNRYRTDTDTATDELNAHLFKPSFRTFVKLRIIFLEIYWLKEIIIFNF